MSLQSKNKYNKDNKTWRKIIVSSFSVTIFTIFIKFLGLIKQVLIASTIGASYETDCFYLSTGIIGHLSILVFSALSISLLSFYTDRIENESPEKAYSLIYAAYKYFIPISILISILSYLFSPLLAHFFAPTYNGEAANELIRFIKIMSLSYVPCCYYLITNVVLEEKKIFIPGRFIGFFQNFLVIIGVFLFYKIFGMISIVYCFLFASVAQALLVTYKARNILKKPMSKYDNSDTIKRLVIIALPVLIGNAVYEINDIVDKQISTGLGNGYASLLTYSASLNEIITGLIVTSVSTVLFANFATHVSQKKFDKVENELILSLEFLFALLIPFTIIFIICGDDITNLFYGRGNMTQENLHRIYYALIGYSAGFVFQSFRAIFVKVLYAFKQTKKTMSNGFLAVVSNIILSIILSKILGLWGISLSTSIAMFIASILLYINVKKVLPNLSLKRIIKSYYKYMIAGIISFIVLLQIDNIIACNYFFRLIIESVICFVIYFSLLIIFKSNIINYFNKILSRD